VGLAEWYNKAGAYFDELADEHFGTYANAAKAGANFVGPTAAAAGSGIVGIAGLVGGLPGGIAGWAGGAAVGAVVGSAAGAAIGVAFEKASLVLTGEPAWPDGAKFP